MYDYAGSIVNNLIQGMYISENATVTIPLTFNLNSISSGIYNIEITLNGDKVVRSIVINK